MDWLRVGLSSPFRQTLESHPFAFGLRLRFWWGMDGEVDAPRNGSRRGATRICP